MSEPSEDQRDARIEELTRENAALKARVAELERPPPKRTRSAIILVTVVFGGMVLAAVLAYAYGGPTEEPTRTASAPREENTTEDDGAPPRRTEPANDGPRSEHDVMLDRAYPMHGLVTTAQLVVRGSPAPDAAIVGWLRLGGRVRLKSAPERTPTCSTGWYELYPRGFVCAGQGVEVAETPPQAPAAEGAADTSSALPYNYYVVREPQVPEYHRLPSRDDQREAIAHRDRYVELLNSGDERRAELLRAGRLPNEPSSPDVVARYLERNFWVASNAIEVRSSRRFIRTVRGSYLKEAQLLQRTGAEFSGVELDEETTLPVAFAVRAARPMRRVVAEDGTERFVEDETLTAYERLQRVPWLRTERHGQFDYHVVEASDGEPRFLRDWFVAVAQRRDPPSGIAADEPWVHVALGSQTLVVYRGPTPIYATLVSSGLEGHDTPVGEFTIRRKFISDTMADLGPEAGDEAYRIEDVPWTQYFDGSVALHGAFWHARFGLRRSHGCVNLAPADARWVFEHTWPEIPAGWHGVNIERGTGFRGSRVIVTQ
jgi:hypothetical protein